MELAKFLSKENINNILIMVFKSKTPCAFGFSSDDFAAFALFCFFPP